MGSYKELINSSSSFAHLLNDIHQHELEEHHLTVDSTTSEIDDIKDKLPPPTNVETKQEGMVKWHVYTAYLRAGAGLFTGLILLTGIYSVREFIAIFSDQWLAKWSEDEGHRYRVFNNCINATKSAVTSMNDTEWTNHRNRRFYIFCGTSDSN